MNRPMDGHDFILWARKHPQDVVDALVESGVLEPHKRTGETYYRVVQPHVHEFVCGCGVRCEIPRVGFDTPTVDGSHRGSQ